MVSHYFYKESAGKLEASRLAYTSEETVERDFQTRRQVQGVGKPHGARTLTDVSGRFVRVELEHRALVLLCNVWLSFFEAVINSIGLVDPKYQ